MRLSASRQSGQLHWKAGRSLPECTGSVWSPYALGQCDKLGDVAATARGRIWRLICLVCLQTPRGAPGGSG